jgi:hypothetical protein
MMRIVSDELYIMIKSGSPLTAIQHSNESPNEASFDTLYDNVTPR